MSTEENNVQPGKKPIIKPMDKHTPIAGPQVANKPAAKPVSGEPGTLGTVSAKDKHTPLGDPQ
ncbi:hypothetical protein [Streptomyces sp. NPDC058773]|uniref:hypothetical protein n=1 Tax=Streptomyces sp. NPDC058773 TaxID=3346632 RepID=UPI00369657A8